MAKVPEVAHVLSFYPRGFKLSLFLLYGQRFPRYGPIFKIAIFRHETWQVAKVPEVAHIPDMTRSHIHKMQVVNSADHTWVLMWIVLDLTIIVGTISEI